MTQLDERQPALGTNFKDQAIIWVKANLLNRWYNSVLTIVFAALIGYLGFFGIRFLLITANWNPVRENLTLFMIGRFPRAEQWRILTQIALLSASIGITWGIYTARAAHTSAQSEALHGEGASNASGASRNQDPFWKRYWAMGLLLAVLLILAKTLLPLAFVAITLATLVAMRQLGKKMPAQFRGAAQYLAVLAFIISYQILSGSQGLAWVWTAGATAVAIFLLSRKRETPLHIFVPAICVAVAGIWVIYSFLIDINGIGWGKWSGFHLNLTVTAVALVLAFPLGILLSLGRKSSLPVIKYLSVGYIEIIRGVPLIGLLFVGDLFLGFFLETAASWSDITRAIFVIAIFTSAYLAEIFRGGFRSVPTGQIDAAKAIGLNSFQAFIWVSFPQALRAIVPALVGQAISLFKDTSLLTIISIVEILRVRSIVHAQNEFLGVGIAETLIFVGFAFWAVSYTMSRESQRLEVKLGVGAR